MSSRDVKSRHRGRSRSTTPDRRHEHRARSTSRDHSKSSKSKHRSKSRDTFKHRSKSRDKSKHRSHSKDKSKHKKKSKKKKASSSSSSSSSSSDEEELKLLQRLEAERQRLKEEKQKQKELLKANETPEEKRARRLREKQEKERKRRERMGWDNEYQCYTDQDNPFGDSALTNTFVWTKKLAKEGVKNVSHEELDALNRQKQLENKVELEKVKQRRREREAERAAREGAAGAAARAREAALFCSWARHEDAFHLRQARLRSQIRIRDQRAKPIDLLAFYVSSEECVDALQMHEPYTYLNGLSPQDLEDLLEDIKVYRELERGEHQAYWSDVQTVVQEELLALRRAASAVRHPVHAAVGADVTAVFKGKSGAQLAALQTQIEHKISGRRDGVDVGYWESLLSQLKAHRARARLRDRHQDNLRRKLQLLKREQAEQLAGGGAGGGGAAPAGGSGGAAPATSPGQSQPVKEEESQASQSEGEGEGARAGAGTDSGDEGSDDEEADGEAAALAAYAAGGYSPAPLSPRRLSPATVLTDAAEDEQRLRYLRARRAAPPTAPPAPGQPKATEEAMRREAARGMGGDEASFGVEHALPDAPCLWADKYRPRKPRYFNRVHTGFEWNKYNQTHYDMDNPPPKIVQGYKFNIFYPDLIDPASTPEFSLKPCAENAEFAVLRFHAGPPYEDIAFKIVNREWEYSYKRGFRCHFHNNIFQLWFHFKRYRYRR